MVMVRVLTERCASLCEQM